MATTTAAAPKIDLDESVWYIEERVDTRQLDENWKPIPGSGDLRPCDCCGRTIEILVYISSKDKRFACVGTSCARKATIYNKDCLSARYTLDRADRSQYDRIQARWSARLSS